ncbi:hypothetical protein H5410_020982, partial [Solanum commersonii]
MKFGIDRFSGRNNFNIWKIQMMVLLQSEGSIHAIDGKYADKISDSDKEKIEGDALSVIQLSLAPNILCEVSTSTEETTNELWKRLEGLYQDREGANQSRDQSLVCIRRMRNVGAVTRRGNLNEIALCESPKKRQ